ncbi:hypothetical protein M8J77_000393 [Diaphorina citri]|nr:hypothetical protein M8J77_000393 [Diaphorina citri]
MQQNFQGITLKEGEYTKQIYSLIRDQRFTECVSILVQILDANKTSRAALSLLAYCYYHNQDFVNASNCYEQLSLLYPEEQDYKLYYAQCLYHACLYDEALKVSNSIESPAYHDRVCKLQAAVRYCQEDLSGALSLLSGCQDSDLDVNQGCILYKEGKYDEALAKFTTALNTLGFEPHLCYNVALCFYQMKEYAPALKHVADIIKRGIRKHPELSVGMATEGIEVRSVGNTLTLYETALIEAFNLKSAIEYQLKNYEAAREALTDMPPRAEEELDAVTLHNQALINMDLRPTDGFEKLQFLLQQNPFPPETLSNLLLLYIKYDYHTLAADVLAEFSHLAPKYLSPYLYDFLDAIMTQETSPEEAYRKFDELASKHVELLRKHTKQVQEARDAGEEEGVKRAVSDYDDTLDRYIPVLMAQAKIYWDMENYSQVENFFHKSVEFCDGNETWRLHVSHVFYMQDKFKEAIAFYEPIVKKYSNNLLNVSAIVLANLCVSYIMTSQNEEAEDLMRKIEKEEERIIFEEPNKKTFHLCIVNLVIGTLYCSKNNYEFGISRVIKSLEPYNKKLGTDTWFYAKRCMLSLIENMSKHMVVCKDSFYQECITFLEQCEVFGKDVPTVPEQPLVEDLTANHGKHTVTYEARLLKSLLLKLFY